MIKMIEPYAKNQKIWILGPYCHLLVGMIMHSKLNCPIQISLSSFVNEYKNVCLTSLGQLAFLTCTSFLKPTFQPPFFSGYPQISESSFSIPVVPSNTGLLQGAIILISSVHSMYTLWLILSILMS